MKVCSDGPGHMSKMAAMPIDGKTLKKLFFCSGTKRLMTLKVDMQHQVFKYYQICSTYDAALTLTYFTGRSNLVSYAFVWEKDITMDFSETVVDYDLKVGRCSQPNEYMKIYEYQRSRLFINLRPGSLRFNIFKLLFLRNCFAD